MARRFARGGYSVAMLARSRERLDTLEREIEHARGYACDVTDEAQLDATIQRVRADLGAPRTRAMTSKPAGDPFFIQPSAIAEEVWHVAQQERSAWSFNVEIRPFAEAW